MENLKDIKAQFNNEIEKCEDLAALEQVRVDFLGRKGKLSLILKGLKELPVEEKKIVGQGANKLKQEIEGGIEKKNREIEAKQSSKQLEKEWVDVTQPILDKKEISHLHPLTQVQNEIEEIFTSMGFRVLDGPELESEYYNFEALNIPESHPARDMQDTFYISSKSKVQSPARNATNTVVGGLKEDQSSNSKFQNQENRLLMRTHTSSVQIRAMQKYGAPLRAIVPGRVFRYEATDARHDSAFCQVEGLMIDHDISVSNLIAISNAFLSKIFKDKIKVRTRPGYFPFVEPGVEMDLECKICDGKGCGVCKGSGWIEFMGAGMVHPNVLEAGNIDSKKFQGFAFGFGITRLVMMKYKIDDIRLLMSGDLRFLKQF